MGSITKYSEKTKTNHTKLPLNWGVCTHESVCVCVCVCGLLCLLFALFEGFSLGIELSALCQ
jgi:hypothetical protein